MPKEVQDLINRGFALLERWLDSHVRKVDSSIKIAHERLELDRVSDAARIENERRTMLHNTGKIV